MTTRRQFLTIAGGVAGLAVAGGAASAALRDDRGGHPRKSDPPEVPDLLLADTDSGLVALRGTGRRLWGRTAVPTVDGKTVYAAGSTADGTTVEVVETTSGRVLSHATLDGRWVPRVTAPDGSLLALSAPDAGVAVGGSSSAPAGRERTTILVTNRERELYRLELPGNFAPDAFSIDGLRLFVLEYLPATAPDRYRVRMVELGAGTPGPLLTRNKAPVPSGAEEEMRGVGRQAALSPDGRTLYTLYTHQPDHRHTRDLLTSGRPSGAHAFVHVLNLEIGWAYCLDLPEPFGQGPAAGHGMALSANGARLYVVDAGSRRMAVANAHDLTVDQVVPVPVGEGEPLDMTVAPDDRSLYLGSGEEIYRLDLAALTVTAAWAAPAPVRGLAVSHDGARLYSGYPGGVAWRSAADGTPAGRRAVNGLTVLRRALCLRRRLRNSHRRCVRRSDRGFNLPTDAPMQRRRPCRNLPVGNPGVRLFAV